MHNNHVAFTNSPKWDSTERASTAELIKEHFHQTQGIDGVPCSYLMLATAVIKSSGVKEKEQTIAFQMIKDYLNIINTYPVNLPTSLDGKPPLPTYTHNAMDNDVICFGKHQHCKGTGT